MSIKLDDIAKRWNERVVPNNWHNIGEEGARLYLKKYGNNISIEKLRLFVQFARMKGCEEFANYIELVKCLKQIR